MRDHPTDLELELARTGEDEIGVAAHLESCEACRARMAAIADLAAALGRPLEPLAIPPERERALLELARARAAAIGRGTRQRPRSGLRVAAVAAGLAAAAAVALLLGLPALDGPAEPADAVAAGSGPNDVNRDGRVDILDALALARAIETDPAAGDRADVDRIARAAVAIGPARGGR
jgi:hypothetical protein